MNIYKSAGTGKSAKSVRIVAAGLLIVFTIMLCSCSFSVTTANLQNIQTASQIDSNNKPVTVTGVFGTTAPYIYLTGAINNAPQGTKVRADWIYTEAEPDISIDSAVLTTVIANDSFSFNLSKPTNNWPVGKYEVKLYIDDKYSKSAYFEVK